jgi:hypothetical protein
MILWPLFDLLALCPILLMHQKNFGLSKTKTIAKDQLFNASLDNTDILQEDADQTVEQNQDLTAAPTYPATSLESSGYEFERFLSKGSSGSVGSYGYFEKVFLKRNESLDHF